MEQDLHLPLQGQKLGYHRQGSAGEDYFCEKSSERFGRCGIHCVALELRAGSADFQHHQSAEFQS